MNIVEFVVVVFHNLKFIASGNRGDSDLAL